MLHPVSRRLKPFPVPNTYSLHTPGPALCGTAGSNSQSGGHRGQHQAVLQSVHLKMLIFTDWIAVTRTWSTECLWFALVPLPLMMLILLCKTPLTVSCKAMWLTQAVIFMFLIIEFPCSLCTECWHMSCCALKEDPVVNIIWFWPRHIFSRRTLPRQRSTFSKQPRWTIWYWFS